MILKGAKVLVIGASGGLGKAVVLELCKQHVGSLFLCGRNEKELLSLQEQGQKCGISTATAAFDLRDESLLTAFFADLENNGEIDAALILSGISLTKVSNNLPNPQFCISSLTYSVFKYRLFFAKGKISFINSFSFSVKPFITKSGSKS